MYVVQELVVEAEEAVAVVEEEVAVVVVQEMVEEVGWQPGHRQGQENKTKLPLSVFMLR